jgi:hypothetical protein
MRKISKRTAVVLGATGVALAAGVAYAAWTSSGSGSGEVKSGTSSSSTIAKLGDGSALYPGASTDITVTIDNPNDYPVVVNSISGGSSALLNTSCAAGSVYSDAVSNPAGTIAPHSSAPYTLHAHMIASPDDACKSQTFTLPLTAQLSSAAS